MKWVLMFVVAMLGLALVPNEASAQRRSDIRINGGNIDIQTRGLFGRPRSTIQISPFGNRGGGGGQFQNRSFQGRRPGFGFDSSQSFDSSQLVQLLFEQRISQQFAFSQQFSQFPRPSFCDVFCRSQCGY